ncbi:MAG: hypothetical protein MRERV_31c003 [Mycoplasmataceae bacterium RV_VA103A]|nr:MAG: hypothetical protein MRERV_31c003 [Mycoplasmataceae bacterium RV_VA103A]
MKIKNNCKKCGQYVSKENIDSWIKKGYCSWSCWMSGKKKK